MPDAVPEVPMPAARVSLREATGVWWRIGWLGFGGPAGQIALMHRELVERRRWIGETHFLQALNVCMLLPGPEAHQLAIYIGWLMHRLRGGLIAGLLFMLPGVLVLGLLSVLYVRFGQQPWATALFFGLKAAVLAIVLDALLRIARRALSTRFLVAMAVAAFIATWGFGLPFPVVVLAAALVGVGAGRWGRGLLPSPRPDAATAQVAVIDGPFGAAGPAAGPSFARSLGLAVTLLALWLAPVALAIVVLGGDHVIAQQGRFFSQAAVVTFGGAYAVLAYVSQRAVEQLGWLQPGEMVDGLALAETTPGPLILVLQFVGFLAAHRFPGPLDPWLAGALGAAMTTWVTFVPSFLFILVGAPYMERLRRHAGLQHALGTITAAVVGVIGNLSLWFALHTLFGQTRRWQGGPLQIDLPVLATLQPAAWALAALAMLALLRWRLGLGRVLLICALLGLLHGHWHG